MVIVNCKFYDTRFKSLFGSLLRRNPFIVLIAIIKKGL